MVQHHDSRISLSLSLTHSLTHSPSINRLVFFLCRISQDAIKMSGTVHIQFQALPSPTEVTSRPGLPTLCTSTNQIDPSWAPPQVSDLMQKINRLPLQRIEPKLLDGRARSLFLTAATVQPITWRYYGSGATYIYRQSLNGSTTISVTGYGATSYGGFPL
jgi:hypothetical protein